MKKIAPIVAIILGAMFTSCAKKNECVCKNADGEEISRTDYSNFKSTKKALCSTANAGISSVGGSCKLQ